MSNTRRDMLTQKKGNLQSYITTGDSCLSIFMSVVKRLTTANASIDDELLEIEGYQKELNDTRDGLAKAKAKNERIIKNINALLEVE